MKDEGGVEPALLAAYLDGGLPEDEKAELQRLFAGSPAAMADLVSAIDLLEVTEGSPLRPPESVRAKARAIMAKRSTDSPASPYASWRVWFTVPWLQVAAGVAAVALVAVIIYRPQSNAPGRPAQSAGSSPSGSKSAMLPGPASGTDVLGPTAARVWGALAVSRDTKAYGTAQGAASREEAEKAALMECASRQGTDCVIAEAGPGQCFAIAREIGGPPVTAAAGDMERARKRAIDKCTVRRKAIFPCAVQFAFCTKNWWPQK